jgi:hypothetical protein
MQPGEIYLAKFPFGDVPGMKLRPVMLLTGTVGSVPEVLVAYISGSAQESDERQTGVDLARGRISVNSAVCETAN